MSLTGEEPDLQLGDTGEGVMLLQVRLYGLGLFPDTPDGTYSTPTETAVRQLQSMFGLDNDGTVTRVVWEAILRQEQNVGINYQYQSPYDALTQLVYDRQQAEQQAGQLSDDGQWRWDGSGWQPAGAAAAVENGVGQLSGDGQWRWDGYDWQPATRTAADAPASGGAGGSGTEQVLSADGQWRWDGQEWQPAGAPDAHVGLVSDDGQWRWDGYSWQPT